MNETKMTSHIDRLRPKTPETKEERIWGKAGFSIIQLAPPQSRPLFSRQDYAIVSQVILGLSEFEIDLIIMKFWRGLNTKTIAKIMEVETTQIESTLKASYSKLRRFCSKRPCFSRSENKISEPLAA